MDSRSSIDHLHQTIDNTYATIQPRNGNHGLSGGAGGNGSGAGIGIGDNHLLNNEFADYATLRNNRQPSVFNKI